MNKEPELLTKEELLRIENINLRRELLNRMDSDLVRDIAKARMLDDAEYGQTWLVQDGRILRVEQKLCDECKDDAKEVAEEIQASLSVSE